MSKEKTIPFTVEKYKELTHKDPNVRVHTKGGVPVRILCTNAKGSNRDDDVIALVGSELGSENVMRYYSNGKLISDSTNKGYKDLVISLGYAPTLKPLTVVKYNGQNYIIDSIDEGVFHVTAVPPYSDHICSAIGLGMENQLIVVTNSPFDDWETTVYNAVFAFPQGTVEERTDYVKETAAKLLDAAKEKILGEYPSKAIYDRGFEAGMSVHNEKPALNTYKDQIEDYLQQKEQTIAMRIAEAFKRGKEFGRKEVYKEISESFRNMGFTVKELEECGGK